MRYTKLNSPWFTGNGWYILRAHREHGGSIHLVDLFSSIKEPYGIYFDRGAEFSLGFTEIIGPFTPADLAKGMGLPGRAPF